MELDGADVIDIGENYDKDVLNEHDGRDLQLEINSYCIYLGGFSDPPSAEQQRILDEFDLLIVDPLNIPASFRDYRSKLTLAKLSLRDVNASIFSEFEVRKPSSHRVVEKRLATRQCQAIFQEGAHSTALTILESIGAGRIDGIYVSDVEQVCNSQGRQVTELVLKNLIPIFCSSNNENIPLVFIEGGSCFASSPSLAAIVNGVLITNPTLRSDGTYQLLNWGTRWGNIKAVINQAKLQTNQRLDFIALALEVLEVPAAKSGWAVARFVKFCKTYKLVGWLTGDPTFIDVEEALHLSSNAVGSMGLISHKMVKAFVVSFDSNQEAHQDDFQVDDSEKTILAELQQIADNLGVPFNRERYGEIYSQLSAEYDDECLDLGSYLWLGMFSRFHTELSAQDKEDLKWDTEDLSQSHKSRKLAQILRLLVSSELGKISQARRKKISSRFNTVPSNPNLGDDVVKKDDYIASKWSGEGTGTLGQREIGYYFRPDEYQRVVDVQERLRQKSLLRDLSTREGSAAHELVLDEAITKIDDVILNPEKHAHIIKAFLKNGEDISHCHIIDQLKDLRAGLDTFSPQTKGCRVIQVWESDPVGLSLHGHGYLSVSKFHESTKVLHVYTSRTHPNLAEALIHCYFQMVGYPHTMCVLLELLAKPSFNENQSHAPKFWDSLSMLPERIVQQIKGSSYEELAWFVHQTQKVYQEIKVQSMSERQRNIASQMANQIRSAAKYLLLDDIQIRDQNLTQNLSILNGTNDFPSSPLKDFDSRLKNVLVVLVDKATWHEPSYCILISLLDILNRGFSLGFLSAQSGPIHLFYDVLINLGRRNALEELEIQIRDSNAYVLGEKDLITVYLEFNGLTEEDSQRFFGVSKFELGGLLYNRIRDKMEYENPEVIEFECPKGSYDISTKDMLSGKAYASNWINGIFFMFFMLVNFVLVLTTGVGLYTSKYTSHPQIVAWAIILSFITAGPLNGAIARLGSMYVYQWSFSLAFVMLTRLLVCGIALACSFIVIAGPILFLTIDKIAALLFVLYYFIFVTMLIFISAISSTK